MTDHAALLRACASGEQSALRALFESESARMIGVAARILRRRDLAEEAVQDTFVQIWRKAAQYDTSRGSALGWIYAILRNRALTILRDGAREDLTPESDLDILREAADDTGTEAFELLHESNKLRECLERLDPSRRQSVLMSYVSGYSHGEIAGRLKVPLGTAKAWVRRGLAQLRECMA